MEGKDYHIEVTRYVDLVIFGPYFFVGSAQWMPGPIDDRIKSLMDIAAIGFSDSLAGSVA